MSKISRIFGYTQQLFPYMENIRIVSNRIQISVMKNSLTTEDYRCRLKMSTNVVCALEDGHRGAVVRGGQRMERKSSVSDAELEILEVLWEAEKPLNAAEIRSLLERNKNWERTTVLTLIQRLVKKGMLKQEKREVYYYQPVVERKAYVKKETRSFVDRFFKGNAGTMAAALMSDDSLTEEDIASLRDFFNSRF